tara:strand:- start:715 stop:1383 length:669 start_codon:yes stop_codon:yes gene_type:complete
MDKKIIALIPARGGSKGIPKKNIKIFKGSPLIVHSINYALSCELINETYVTTDDMEIAKIATDAGAKVIDRPKNLSLDESSTESAIQHALDELTNKPDIIILLQPTSPIRPPNSLKKGLKIYSNGKYDSLLSISPTHNFFWNINNDIAEPNYNFMNRPRRQDMKDEDISYIENGSLYIFSYEHFIKTKNRLGGKIGYIIFPEEFSLEIDTMLDFTVLENYEK